MTLLSSKDYQKLVAEKRKASKESKPEKSKLSTKEALKQMAVYFELDEKKTRYFIKQLELSGNI